MTITRLRLFAHYPPTGARSRFHWDPYTESELLNKVVAENLQILVFLFV